VLCTCDAISPAAGILLTEPQAESDRVNTVASLLIQHWREIFDGITTPSAYSEVRLSIEPQRLLIFYRLPLRILPST
jgi:hypothetical protein